MQAAVQRYVDSSISKTINMPADIPFDRFKDVYTQAYALGCKGCTTYRPNEVTGAVLEARPEMSAAEMPAPQPRPRQSELPLPAPPPARRPADPYEAGGVAGRAGAASFLTSSTAPVISFGRYVVQPLQPSS